MLMQTQFITASGEKTNLVLATVPSKTGKYFHYLSFFYITLKALTQSFEIFVWLKMFHDVNFIGLALVIDFDSSENGPKT